jgi:hypothetical protein
MGNGSEIFRRDQAQMHAPKSPEETAVAARDLAQSGFSNWTISCILRLDIGAVRQLVGERRTI